MAALRSLFACAVVALAGLAASIPGLRSPVARLANYRADPPGPQYDVPVDGNSLRRAGSILPDRSTVTYFVYSPAAGPVLRGNLHAGTELYALPALPVQVPQEAGWVLSYRAPRLLPPELRSRRVYRLGSGVALVEIDR